MPEEPKVGKLHPVPQQILSVEFKLVGELTVRQFGYVAIFAVLAFFVYAAVPFPGFLKLLVAGPLALLGVALAFVPIQDVPFDRWVGLFFKAIFSPTRRVWIKESHPPEIFFLEVPQIKERVKYAGGETRLRMETYLKTMGAQQKEAFLEEREAEFLKALKFDLPLPKKVRAAPLPVSVKPTIPERKIQEQETLAGSLNWTREPVLKVAGGGEGGPRYFSALSNVKVGRSLHYISAGATMVTAPARELVIEEKEEALAPEVAKLPQVLPPAGGEKAPPPSGAPQPQGSREMRFTPTPKIPEKPKLEEHKIKETHEGEIEALSEQNKILAEQIAQLSSQLTQLREMAGKETKEKETLLSRLQETKKNLESLERQKEWAEKRIGHLSEQKPVVKISPPLAPKEKKKILPIKGKPIEGQAAKPNLIRGIVKDAQGEVIEEAIIVIKDRFGDPVRALKTNPLGQFAISTPLHNGSYTIEIAAEGYSFDIMEIDLTGEVLAPMEFVAK